MAEKREEKCLGTWEFFLKQADECFAVVLPDSHVVGKKKRVEVDQGRGKNGQLCAVQEINVARSQGQGRYHSQHMTPPPRLTSSYLEEQTKVAGSRRRQGTGRG